MTIDRRFFLRSDQGIAGSMVREEGKKAAARGLNPNYALESSGNAIG